MKKQEARFHMFVCVRKACSSILQSSACTDGRGTGAKESDTYKSCELKEFVWTKRCPIGGRTAAHQLQLPRPKKQQEKGACHVHPQVSRVCQCGGGAARSTYVPVAIPL